jgi:glyoxylate reductase
VLQRRPKIFVTRALPPAIIAELARCYRVEMNRRDRPLTPPQLIRGVGCADGMIAMLSDRIDRRVIAAGARLRVIANYAAGTNNVDLAAASAAGVAVTNTPGALTETTADLAWALMLGVARRLREGEVLVRSGRWTGWAPTQLLGADLHGAVLGIVGMGRIGQAVARRAAGFGMTVLYAGRRPLPAGRERRLGARRVALAQLLARADFVTLHLPLTPESHHLIDRHALARMKPTAYLINTARGPVVDEAALIDALERGRIAGAGLDVFEREPRVPARLRRLPTALLLPHLGSATERTRLAMGRMVLANLDAVFRGRRPPHRVNP